MSRSIRKPTPSEAICRERTELETDPAGERRALTAIYVLGGLVPDLAQQVAEH